MNSNQIMTKIHIACFSFPKQMFTPLHSTKCWVISTQIWVIYWQTQMLV